MLIEHNNDVHPDLEIILKRLDEEEVRALDALEFAFLYDLYDFFTPRRGGLLLEILDAAPHFFQEHIQGVFDRLMSSYVNARSKPVHEVGGLEHLVIVAFWLIDLHPGGRIFHRKIEFFAREQAVVLAGRRPDDYRQQQSQ
jgi:hypothetical protein